MPSNCGLYVDNKIFQNENRKEEILIGINHWDWDVDIEMELPEYDQRLAGFGFSKEIFDDLVKLVRNEVVENGGSGGGCLWKWCDCYSDKYCNFCYLYLTLGLAGVCHMIVGSQRDERNKELKRKFNQHVQSLQEGRDWKLSLITDPSFYEAGRSSPWKWPQHPYPNVEKSYGVLISMKFSNAVPWDSEPPPPVVTQYPYGQQQQQYQQQQQQYPYVEQQQGPPIIQNPYAQPPPPYTNQPTAPPKAEEAGMKNF